MEEIKLGDNLKKFRNKKDFSYERVGRELGVSFNTVNRWENRNKKTGKYVRPDIETIVKLKKLYNVRLLDELVFSSRTVSDSVIAYLKENPDVLRRVLENLDDKE